MSSYETTCEECGIKLRIEESSMNVPGGKEKEEANCPKCGNVVASCMTSGFIRAFPISDKDKK